MNFIILLVRRKVGGIRRKKFVFHPFFQNFEEIIKTRAMNKLVFLISLLLTTTPSQSQELDVDLEFDDAVPVLNLGTFHMGYTPDANTTEFDEHDENNIREVHKIAKAIAAFQPTIIIVETLPEDNDALKTSYLEYLKDPEMKFKNPSEIELLAFEVGRLSNTSRIYGIDFREGYNYRIASQLKNSLDSSTYFRYMTMLDKLEKQHPTENMALLEQFQVMNDSRYQDILININADMLTHVSTKNNAEGANEAAKFYHRNLVMYSNLNQIEVTGEDRIFILMGGTHTAFFKMWLERSPKYDPVDVSKFLQ